jgi:hypothetical protein
MYITIIWIRMRMAERRRLKNRGVARATQRRRLPIIPFLHFTSAMILSIFLALVVTNRINARSGKSHLLMILWVTPYNMIELFALRKIVSLGNKLIPWNAPMQIDDMSRFDFTLKTLLRIVVSLFLLSWIFAIVGCAVEPLTYDKISLWSLFGEQFFYFTSLVYQVRLTVMI